MSPPGALPPGLDSSALHDALRAALGSSVPSGAAIGVAASGGPDSTGLALLLAAARPDLVLRVLHVRHGLRDDRVDAMAAAALAGHLGVACDVVGVRVTEGAGPEDAARRARHAALRDLSVVHGLVGVAFGHTAEDQAETVLLAVVRGAGLTGLAGMRPVRSAGQLLLLRPLLRVRRADVRAVAAASGLPLVEDPTNTAGDQRRARARHEVLPALARLAGGPGDPVATLTRLAALAADDDAHLDVQAAGLERALVATHGPVRLLRRDALAGLPPALARRVVRRVLAGAGLARLMPSARDVEVVRELASGAAAMVGGGAAVTCSQGWVVVRPATTTAPPPRPLTADGDVEIPEIAHVLSVAVASASQALPPRPTGAWVPGAPAAAFIRGGVEGWSVRGVRPGDAIAAGGARRAVREILRALGVPTAVRDLVPVVLDARGTPAWIPGAVPADLVLDPARDTAGTILRLEPSGTLRPPCAPTPSGPT